MDRKFCISTIICLVVFVPNVLCLIQPALDAREIFATNFYRVYNFHANSSNNNVIISPAGIQKMLTVVYGGAEYNLADSILWDIRLKHIDMKRLMEEAKLEHISDLGFATHLNERQHKELQELIPREDVFEYFKSDFRELEHLIDVHNYIVAPKQLQFDEDFKEFAKNYFDVQLLNKPIAEVEEIFGNVVNNDDQVELYSSLSLNINFKHDFNKLNKKTVQSEGTFRYGKLNSTRHSDFEAKVLELPLKSETKHLNMIIVLPKTKKFFNYFISQVMGRELIDFTELTSALNEETVQVTLPLIDINWQTNLADCAKDVSTHGLKKLFTEPANLESMFDKVPNGGIKVGSFWQKAQVHITTDTMDSKSKTKRDAHVVDKSIDLAEVKEIVESIHKDVSEHKQRADTIDSTEATTKVFDATNKLYFFVIKSEKSIYFMGHSIS